MHALIFLSFIDIVQIIISNSEVTGLRNNIDNYAHTVILRDHVHSTVAAAAHVGY